MSSNNSNEKIIIKEIDNTKPSGLQTSSDIAFVVGFAGKSSVVGVPTLCTSVAEFQELFGTEPYVLQEKDVTDYKSYGIEAGPDRGFKYAYELVKSGMSVVFSNLFDPTKVAKNQSVLRAIYPAAGSAEKSTFAQQLDMLSDKNEYSVKYITSGGYPAIVPYTEDEKRSAQFTFGDLMVQCASNRGDAVALLDYPIDQENVLFDTTDSIYTKISGVVKNLVDNGSYGTIMYPWGKYKFSKDDVVNMPASFGYLLCVSAATKRGPNWLAMAGVNRGVVPYLTELLVKNGLVRNKDAEEMQPKSGDQPNQKYCINCITNIRPYGLTIWGNRTLEPVSKDGLKALNFLNIRNMISDIKKVVYTSAKAIMFEQNTEVTWLKFKSMMSPLLDQMKQGFAISDYKILKLATKYDGTALGRGELVAVIRIYPIDSIEYFELTVEINDKDVSLS